MSEHNWPSHYPNHCSSCHHIQDLIHVSRHGIPPEAETTASRVECNVNPNTGEALLGGEVTRKWGSPPIHKNAYLPDTRGVCPALTNSLRAHPDLSSSS